MIFTFIIHALLSLVTTLFSVLPTLAATPEAVITGGQWVIDTIYGVVSMFRMIYGSALMTAIVVVIVGLFSFEWIYHTVMWIVRKIPMINMK